jgi:ankyrin repeat protein
VTGVDQAAYLIGEFAERSGLTRRALRLYDDAGLLVPAFVDESSGYRYYRDDQLRRARLIATLRAAGVPIGQVMAIVEADPALGRDLLDRWWASREAEHEASAALVPRIHDLLLGRTDDMPDDHQTAPPAPDAAFDAVRRGDPDALQRVLAEHPDVLAGRDGEGRTLLAEAARVLTADHALPAEDAGGRHRNVVDRLLEAGADPNVADARGWTPLHAAAISGHTWLTQRLLDGGARRDPVVEGIDGATPIAYALFYHHVETARALGAGGPVPNNLRVAAALGAVDDLRTWLAGGRPLPEAARQGIEFYGPPEWFPSRPVPDDQHLLDEALTWASRCNQVEAMDVLVQHGADVNANPHRGTALLCAVWFDQVEAAAWLLDHGADPDLRHGFGGGDHGEGAVALHLAAQYGQLGCLQLLLDRGADATIVDEAHGSTPVGWARFGEQPEAMALLERHLARA